MSFFFAIFYIILNKKSFSENKHIELGIDDYLSFNISPEYIKHVFLEESDIINFLKKLNYENLSSLSMKLSISNGKCILLIITSSNPNNVHYLYQLADLFSEFLQNSVF